MNKKIESMLLKKHKKQINLIYDYFSIDDAYKESIYYIHFEKLDGKITEYLFNRLIEYNEYLRIVRSGYNV